MQEVGEVDTDPRAATTEERFRLANTEDESVSHSASQLQTIYGRSAGKDPGIRSPPRRGVELTVVSGFSNAMTGFCTDKL